LLEDQIPGDFDLPAAMDRGDCFFDAVAQGMNQIFNTSDWTAKRLRLAIEDYVKGNPDSWVQPTITKEEKWNEYLVRIGYTADDIDKDIVLRGEPIWGRPRIEGRILCALYDIKIHVFEALEMTEAHTDATQPIVMEQIVTQDKSISIENMEREAYDDGQIIHLVCHRNHFVLVLIQAPDSANINEAVHLPDETSVQLSC